MGRYLVLVSLPGERSAERDRKLDLEMGKADFSTFFVDQNEKFYLPAGSYHHDQPDLYRSPDAAHTAAAAAARNVDPAAAVIVFPIERAFYTGTSSKRT